MAAKRSNEYVAPKKQKTYREPSDKKLKKIREQQVLYDLSKECFGKALRSVDVQTRHRKKENYFKIKIKGFSAVAQITVLHTKLHSLFDRYRLDFSGSINSKTDKEELFIHVTTFNQEEHYETEGISHSCECSKAERNSGVFGQTEVRINHAFSPGR
jgi:hypothetical protein